MKNANLVSKIWKFAKQPMKFIKLLNLVLKTIDHLVKGKFLAIERDSDQIGQWAGCPGRWGTSWWWRLPLVALKIWFFLWSCLYLLWFFQIQSLKATIDGSPMVDFVRDEVAYLCLAGILPESNQKIELSIRVVETASLTVDLGIFTQGSNVKKRAWNGPPLFGVELRRKWP